MSALLPTEHNVEPASATPLVVWGLVGGGALFFVGGSMHPGDDPPGLSLKEHLHLLFSDPAWYPSHALLLAGMVLLALSLVGLARGGTLATASRAQKVGAVAAVAAVLAALGMLLHLVAATEADRIAAGQGTPITDLHVGAETLTVPAFGFSIAALALIGGLTRSVGNRGTAALGVVGGVSYGLAGGTFLFTDRLNFLFPGAGAVGLWAIAAGIWLLLRCRPRRRFWPRQMRKSEHHDHVNHRDSERCVSKLAVRKVGSVSNVVTTNTHRWGVVPLLAALLVVPLALAPAAGASEPEREVVPAPDAMVLSGQCDFDVLGEILGGEIDTTFFDKTGDPVKKIAVFPGQTLMLTNLATNQTITVVNAGSTQARAKRDGSVEISITGHGPIQNDIVGGKPGLWYLDGGRILVTLEPEGSLESITVSGNVVNLCERLAPPR